MRNASVARTSMWSALGSASVQARGLPARPHTRAAGAPGSSARSAATAIAATAALIGRGAERVERGHRHSLL
eukprot:scaffold79666_cov34-Tisochrysis_lutea.AAC.1